jgi:predicted Zn-dependent peptidase
MKKFIPVFIAAIFTCSTLTFAQAPAAEKQTPPAGSAPKPFKLPAMQKFSLANGVQVTLVPFGSIPKVMIDVTVRAGNLNEVASQVWLADFTGELMKEGTTSRTSEQVAQQAAAMGGTVSVDVGPDLTRISGDVLSEFGPKMAELLADVAQHPLLPESEVARIKQDFLRQLSVQKAQPGTMARERFYQALYPDHPYGRILSTEAIINSYTAEQARKFYADNFGAARTRIYVAGKFDPIAVKAAITRAFSSWSRGPVPVINIPKTTARHEFDMVDRPGAAQSTLYIGLPAIDPSQPDFIPLQVMNSLLGGSFASRITSNIREQKGYTYSPNSQLSVRYRDAFWVETADVTTAVTGPSIKEILYEIDRLQKAPPSEAEVNGIKNFLGGAFVIQNSSRAGIIGRLQYADLHELPGDYLETYVQKIFAVTPEQVQQTAKYIATDRLTMVVVGDKAKITDQVAAYAGGSAAAQGSSQAQP